jgi:Glycosyltransferase family 87
LSAIGVFALRHVTDQTRRVAWRVHAPLALVAVLVLVLQWRIAVDHHAAWALLEVPVAAWGLWLAWRQQARLSLPIVLGLSLGLHLASILLFRHLGYAGDQDPNQTYLDEGHRLLDGHYPASEYPVAGVLLFAVEAAVEPHPPQIANALLMLPFSAACVWGIWALRTRWSAWLATVVAFWPLAEYYWEFRYDATAAALLVLGLVLARQGRWGWSGAALALGACFKWTPALAAVVLVVWLLSGRRLVEARRQVVAFVGVVALFYVPCLVVWPAHDVLASFRIQGRRPLTQESLWFWPARLVGLAHWSAAYWDPAGAPRWFDVLATVVQVALVVALTAAAAARPAQLDRAVALAALTPVAFLVTNRVFSLQFVLVLTVGWAVAAALFVFSRREQLLIGAGIAAAVAANAFMYPYSDPTGVLKWPAYALPGWIVIVGLTCWLVRRVLADLPRPG